LPHNALIDVHQADLEIMMSAYCAKSVVANPNITGKHARRVKVVNTPTKQAKPLAKIVTWVFFQMIYPQYLLWGVNI